MILHKVILILYTASNNSYIATHNINLHTIYSIYSITIYTPNHLLYIAMRDYHHVEVDGLISERLCIDIPIINNFMPGTAVQLLLKASSNGQAISTVPSILVIVDDG